MTRHRPLSIGAPFTALLLAMLSACGSGNDHLLTASPSRAADELRETGLGQYLGAQAPSRTSQSGRWTDLFFDPAEEGAICLTGNQFQVSFHDGPSDQVLLYLQGGGACWDYVTCHVLETATTSAGGAVQSGIIDIDNPENPFKDFDIVYVPYCDGSVFVGDARPDYNGVPTFHHGLRNLSVAVDVITREFPDASRIVVSGSSAGGYGTYTGYGVARVAFPETPIIVLNDSGPGLQNHAASEDVQNRSENWNFTRLIPASCTDCSDQFSYLTSWALDRDPTLRTALYSYQQDGVISFFIDLSGPEYQDLLLDVSGKIHDRDPDRFKRFMPLGTDHTQLFSPTFYTQTIRGVSLLEWTRGFLDDSDGWVDTIE